MRFDAWERSHMPISQSALNPQFARQANSSSGMSERVVMVR